MVYILERELEDTEYDDDACPPADDTLYRKYTLEHFN
jgi:hypothetical protein